MVTAVPGTGMSWVVQHEHTGLVVPPNDTEALAGALARFREAFSIDASAEAIAKIYNELME